jgi:hypothetical protein
MNVDDLFCDRGSRVPEVGAHIASSLLIGAAAVVVSGILAFVAARKCGGRSRRRREINFLFVGACGLMAAGGLMYLRLHALHG